MPDQFVQSHIRHLPLFQTMSTEQLGHVADAFDRFSFQPGEVIFYQGQQTTGMYLFVEGEGRFIQEGATGGQDVVGYVRENQYIDEPALFSMGFETATLQVTHPAIVLYLSRQKLLDVISHFPDVRMALQTHIRTADGRVQERATHDHRFPTQRPNEVVLLERKKHWWAFARYLWISGFLFIALGILALLSPSILTLIFGVMAFIIPGLIAIYSYLEWQNDAVIVTDQRIVKIDRTIRSLRTRINEVPLDSVQGVATDIPGRDPFARAFRYGTVFIETPGDSGNMILERMPNPNEMQQMIFTNREQYIQRQASQHRSSVRTELDKILSDQSTGETTGSQKSRGPSRQQRSSLLTRILPTEMQLIDENGDTVYRKHYMIWVSHIFFPVLMLAAAFVLIFFGLFDVAGIGVIGLLLGFGAFFVGGVWFWWADWDWRNDLYVVSDNSVTLIHKRPLFLQNEVDQIRLDRVENVVSDKGGIFGTLFNIGDVRLSLLGADFSEAKVFKSVHNPHDVQAEISQRQARLKSAESNRQAQNQREMITDYIAAYHDRNQPQTPGAEQPAQAQPIYPQQAGYDTAQPGYGQYDDTPQAPPPAPPPQQQSPDPFDGIAGPPGLRRLDRDDDPYA